MKPLDNSKNELCAHCVVRGVQGKTYHKVCTCKLYPYTPYSGGFDSMRGTYENCDFVQLNDRCEFAVKAQVKQTNTRRYEIRHR